MQHNGHWPITIAHLKHFMLTWANNEGNAIKIQTSLPFDPYSVSFLVHTPSLSWSILSLSYGPYSVSLMDHTYSPWTILSLIHGVYSHSLASLGGSVGCVVRLETRRSRVQPPPRSATFFRGDWSWNIFYSHSLPSADSRRAVVSFWQKNVHNTS